MSIKLCVVDMDGTLLNSDHEITDENLRAIQALRDNNIDLVVATGRLDTMIKPYTRKMAIEQPTISCNGALTRNLKSNETIASFPIDPEACLEIIDICRYYQVPFQMYSEYNLYGDKLEGRLLFLSEYNKKLDDEDKMPIVIVNDCKTLVKSGKIIYKVLISNDDSNKLDLVSDEINQIEKIEAYRSAKGLLDVMNDKTSKGKALEAFAKLRSIAREEIVVFGDNHNDISMFEFAGLSIAMGNAEEEVKSIADYVTLSNDHSGVAKGLFDYILKIKNRRA